MIHKRWMTRKARVHLDPTYKENTLQNDTSFSPQLSLLDRVDRERQENPEWCPTDDRFLREPERRTRKCAIQRSFFNDFFYIFIVSRIFPL